MRYNDHTKRMRFRTGIEVCENTLHCNDGRAELAVFTKLGLRSLVDTLDA